MRKIESGTHIFECMLVNALQKTLSSRGISVEINDPDAFYSRGKISLRHADLKDRESSETLFQDAVSKILERELWMTNGDPVEIITHATPIFVNRDVIVRAGDRELAFTCNPVQSVFPSKYLSSDDFMQWMLGHDIINRMGLNKLIYIAEVEGLVKDKKYDEGLKRAVSDWFIEELQAQYEQDRSVPASIIKNLFISAPVYEFIVSQHADHIAVAGYDPVGDESGVNHTPYPTAFTNMEYKRNLSGSVLPGVVHVEMDHGWSIAIRTSLLQNKTISNRIRIAFSLTEVPKNRFRINYDGSPRIEI